MFFFLCNSCLAILPDALSLSKYLGQLGETLDTKFKTLSEKLYDECLKHSDVQVEATKLSQLDSNCFNTAKFPK